MEVCSRLPMFQSFGSRSAAAAAFDPAGVVTTVVWTDDVAGSAPPGVPAAALF